MILLRNLLRVKWFDINIARVISINIVETKKDKKETEYLIYSNKFIPYVKNNSATEFR